jgi:hypothetical protein
MKIDKPVPAEVRAVVDLVKLRDEWERACGREDRAEKSLSEVRLEKGRILVEARKAFPARGPKAKGWGELLEKWKVDQKTAWNYMSMAGFVEEREISETFTEIPTYAEAGIVKPRNTESIAQELKHQAFAEAWHERERREASKLVNGGYFDRAAESIAENERAEHDRVLVEKFFPGAQARIQPIDERTRRAQGYIEAIQRGIAVVSAATKVDGFSLTDVTTSPQEFEQAKGLTIEFVNLLLSQLEAAGVLDGTEKRRQLKLLDGGKS